MGREARRVQPVVVAVELLRQLRQLSRLLLGPNPEVRNLELLRFARTDQIPKDESRPGPKGVSSSS